MSDKPYYVYMLSCGDGSLYTGITTDVPRRLREHQAGKGAKYTRSHLPVTLAYQELQPDKSSALRRELELKRLPREKKKKLIENMSVSEEMHLKNASNSLKKCL